MANTKLREENNIKAMTYWRDKFDEWLKAPQNIREFGFWVSQDSDGYYGTMYGTIKFSVSWGPPPLDLTKWSSDAEEDSC